MSSVATSAPDQNTFEVSLFGPGMGECLVVHLGNGEWIIVDSCFAEKKARVRVPVAVEYLTQLGVDIPKAVKLIVATHWHDDHIKGLSEIVELAKKSDFVCSSAFHHDDFYRVVAGSEKARFRKFSSGVDEFRTIWRSLEQGRQVWASENVSLLTSTSGVAVKALSPSGETIKDSFRQLSKIIPRAGGQIKRATYIKPNHTSIVIQITTPTKNVLLGADLENRSESFYGWNAIANSKGWEPRKSHIYKVAHHGSQNAHPTQHWGAFIENDPDCLVTPFTRLSSPLPTLTDVQRLKQHGAKLYCTVWPLLRKPYKHGKRTDQIMDKVFLSRTAMPSRCGHVRLRFSLTDPAAETQVDLYDGASAI